MTTGIEWLIDASGCPADALANLAVLRALCDAVVADLELRVVGAPQWHRFPSPGGVTGLYLLSESHLACHTFPELGIATFNLYCCRPRAPWPWNEQLSRRLEASHVAVTHVARGEQPQADLDAPKDSPTFAGRNA